MYLLDNGDFPSIAMFRHHRSRGFDTGAEGLEGGGAANLSFLLLEIARDTSLMAEIWRSPVEIGSLSHYLQGFILFQVVVWDSKRM